MYTIEIKNPCSCAKKRKAWMKELSFDSLEAAEQTATKMCTQGNEKFCKRHKFTYTIEDKEVIIDTLSAK